MVHVIGSPFSTCTQRVFTTLAELNVTDFTVHEPDFMHGELSSAPHVAKQPFAMMPIVEDGDFRIFESRAICRYLADKYSDRGAKLIPDLKDIKARALFEQWASVEYANYESYVGSILEQKLFNKHKGLDPIPEIVNYYTAKLNQKLDTFEKVLGKQKYMGGDEFSLVDIFYIPHTQKLFVIGDGAFIESRPNVKAWWERVSTRESWKQCYKEFVVPT